MHPILQKAAVKMAVPLARRWVSRQESVILAEGRKLMDWELIWAKEVGIAQPESVRILPVPVVPTPGSSILRFLARFARMTMESPSGIALQYGIYLDSAEATNPSLLVHELAHVAQYERLGGIKGFLIEYLTQCLRDGYWDAFLEREAREMAAKYSRRPER